MLRTALTTAILLGLAGTAPGQTGREPKSLLGFKPETRPGQLRAEAQATAVPTPESARRWLKALTAEPHVAGTPADHRTALFVKDRLQEWGWNVEIAPLEVLLNYPRGKPKLELLRPRVQELSLDEQPIPGDKDSASSAAFGAFHGYGVGGVASGQVVYVNYGRDEDFEVLEKQGVTVEGKVVLARYGGNFRGLKVRAAQRRGASGILIYSDPADDGYARGDVYPAGPYRPGSAIQRGSVQFLSMGPGDPSTPAGPSTKDARRLPIAFFEGAMPPEAVKSLEREHGVSLEGSFARIPSLPISYDTAAAILRELAGPVVPSGWQGGLPITYHIGPGPAEVKFSINMDYAVRTIWNVIGTLRGSAEPDRWIMVGNHRDAWVYGAVDPCSGTASTLEMCRAIGAAVTSGWKPRRTIVYASWDAEEYGLVGSTEWAELNAKEVEQKAALMLNVDSAVSGRDLSLSGVPSLRDLTLEVAGTVTDVRSGRNLRDLWIEARRKAWAASSPLEPADPLWGEPSEKASKMGGARGFEPQMQPLGSGSDYTVFVDHLGVPAADVDFSGRYGVYHSIYDNFTWMEKHGDPEFLIHTQAARLYTAFVMRAAAADILPLRFSGYGEAMRDYLDELRLQQARDHRARAGGAEDEPPPTVRFAGVERLVQAVRSFQVSARRLDRALDEAASRDDLGEEALGRINDKLTRVERAFLLPEGLPGRPWFRHAIYAPGVTTGYGAWPFPAIRQALEEHRGDKLDAAVASTVAVLSRATAAIDQALQAATR